MQVLFKKIELAGERAEGVFNFVIRTQNADQVEELFRGDDVVVFGRGNKRTDVSFTTHRLHTTPEAASTFVMEHTIELDGVGTVTFITQRGKRFLYGATLGSSEGTFKGRTSIFKYQIIGGRIETKVKPQ